MKVKDINLTEVLEKGTPKQKALLIIANDEASEKGKELLTAKEVASIKKSFKGKPEEATEYNRYLEIAEIYSINRFRFYALQENIKKLSAHIASLCTLWEYLEHQTEAYNTILTIAEDIPEPHRSQIEGYIYNLCKSWNMLLKIRRTEGSRYLEADTTNLQAKIDSYVNSYRGSLSVAKAFVEASEKFMKATKARAFIPKDIDGMLDYFVSPKLEIPDLYRRDSYLKLMRERGLKDKEVQYRQKYAILPAWEEIEADEDTNADEIFTL